MPAPLMRGTHRFPPMDAVIYGEDFATALAREVTRLDARRVFVLMSRSVADHTDAVARTEAALGDRLAAIHRGIGAHTPRPDVVAAAEAARGAGADLLVTIGGGSQTDAAKMVGLCLGNDVRQPADLDALAAEIRPDGTTRRPPTRPPALRSIAVPTTLSAGEFTAFAGCTDPVRQVKESFGHPLCMPRTVILDPTLAAHTPAWLWLSTGIRAVDHAVEDICSVASQPFSDGASLHAQRLLKRGLIAVHARPDDLAARLDCQLGAWMSIMGSQNGVPKGASHGIGHVLGGTAGVPHGYTSCVMLPHVMRYNLAVTAERQAWIAEALGRPGEPAADAVAALIAALGLPSTLRDVGVREDQLDQIARESMHDRCVHTNPRPIEGPAAVRALLDAAW
jgi:maleylacetate reductase